MNLPHRVGFLLFAILLPLLLLGIQFLLYRYWRGLLRERFQSGRGSRLALAVVFIVFNAGLLAVLAIRPRLAEYPSWFMTVFAYPFFIWFGATFFIGLGLLGVKLVKAPFTFGLWVASKLPVVSRRLSALRSSPEMTRFNASRRRFLQEGAMGLAAVSFAGTAYGVLVGRGKCETTQAEFEVAGLPPSLDGFAIALATDIHSGIYMTRGEMEEYVDRLNALEADVTVVVGDFVNGLTQEVYPFAEAFSRLRAPLGVFGATGNHDYYAQEPATVIREVNDCGVRLLQDEHVVLHKNGSALCLAGVDDVNSVQTARRGALAALIDAPPSLVRVLLCHRPYYLPEFARQRIDLVLSGHTHGGQVRLGSIGNTIITPAAMASPYISGPYRSGGAQMYVSRGIGTVGVPMRINCPPEITRIVLRTAPASTRG